MKAIFDAYPFIVIGGLILVGVTFAYVAWHFFFMGIFPIKKTVEAKLKEKSLLYTPELGYTLADGGEELTEKKEAKDEKEGVS